MAVVFPEELNLADYLLDARVREGLGDRRALLVDRGERVVERSYRQVQALANRYARVLAEIGVEPEQRVIVALPDGEDYVGALFGILKLGAVVVMVNPRLPGRDLGALFDYCRPKAAIVGEEALAALAKARTAAPWPRVAITAGVAADDRGRHNLPSFEELDSGREEWDNEPTHRDDPAIWLFSGGTTGRPKAVVQSHRSFAFTTECYAKRTLGYRPDDVTLSVPKLFFGYATGSNLFFPFSVGATAVLFAEHPTAELLFEKIERHRPSILVNVPKMVHQMVADERSGARDLSSLRFATSAGEALPVPLYERWREAFGVELLDGLGTAEMWHVFLTNRPGDVVPGTLGKVVEGFEIRVRDDRGRDVADGDVGQLWVRGGARAWGYWRNAAKTQEAFRGEWFVGGDLVSRDAGGNVTYHGRGDDVLKVGGKWLVPAEVESCLLRHPRVEECAVIGVADEDGLTKPHAFVVAGEGAPAAGPVLAEELKRFVIEHLAPYKHPREVQFVDSLPRTHLGKTDRGKLRRSKE